MAWKMFVCIAVMVVSIVAAFPHEKNPLSIDEGDSDLAPYSAENDGISANKDISAYNPEERPRNRGNETHPVNIEINFYLRDVEEIDNFRQDIKLQLTFRQQWQDDRLKFDGNEEVEYLTITDPSRIWTPDTFIGNERSGFSHNLLKPNVLVRVYPSGKVLFSTRFTAVIKCLKNFKDYPFDRQECYTIFASYGYTTKDVTYSWRDENPVMVANNPHSPPFELERYYTEKCGPVQTKTGHYDCLKVSFVFKRNALSILLKTFFPAAVFVALSWMSFWMAAKFVGARCMVLVSTLVSTTLVYYFLVDALPPVSYTRSMDKWMWTCIAFIFAAVIEFLAVVTLSKKQEDQDCAKIEPFAIASPEKAKKRVVRNLKDYVSRQSPQNWAAALDKISRVIFPLAFILFLVIYFVQAKRDYEKYEEY